ncbi:MAG: citrate synthase/methylcitrate synthase [Elusimicrobiota bacterium]|nr:citrate synthase/methylcitrate synthase [Elusimicrobiota bacterium]
MAAPTAPSSQVKPGLEGVVATETKLSMVDGNNGVLIIAGYPIEEFAGKVSIEEAAMLLWTGQLPSKEEAPGVQTELAGYRALRPETIEIIKTARSAPPIDALRMACATLSLDVSNPNDISPAADLALAKRLLARFPTVIAAHARLRQGLDPIAPRSDLSLAANFLYMVFGQEPHPAAAKALETYWVTVSDHGMNASTFTGRVIASTRSDMVSAVTGAVGALKGPLHGGAPGPVLDMLVDIKTADKAEAWLRKEIKEGRRIMGFGHRVYKVRDPRAEVLAKTAKEMAGAHLQNKKLYDLACSVEQTAIRVLEELKPGRNLKTNVEFYTALVLQSVGLQPDQFVSMFACGRVVGWCAHVMEQHAQDRLIRPQSEYVGPRGLKLNR